MLMRYFFYTNGKHEKTLISVDENSDVVVLTPDRANRYSLSKSDWMHYYGRREADNHKKEIFEVCESQAKKFIVYGILPMNFDD